MNILTAFFSANWIGPIITAFIMVVSGLYIRQSAKIEAEKVVKTSYENAIAAMKAHIDALQDRIKDTELENIHLRETIESIFELLKARDIYISVQGHIITIREGKDTTITNIRKEESA